MKHIIGVNLTPASAASNSSDPVTWIAVGREAAKAGRHDDAQTAFMRAVQVDPNSAAAHFQVGREHYRRDQLKQARASFERAVELRPDYPQAQHGLGVVLQLDGEWANSELAFRRALAARPELTVSASSLANSLVQLGRLDEAETLFRHAIECDPGLMEAHQGLGLLLHTDQRLVEAEQMTRNALARWPQSADLQLNLGLLLLAAGRYAEAWPYYEARHASSMSAEVRRQPLPDGQQWAGESLAGKSLHVVAEQGFGDLIQVARYVPVLREMGLSTLTMECAVPLRPLLRELSGIDELVTSASAQFDVWCYCMSLPRLLGTQLHTIPSTIPYLPVPQDRVEFARSLIGGPTPAKLRVGLVWKGMPANRNDANRSLPSLASLAPLWSVKGVQFISLQKGAGEDEAKSPPDDQPIVPAGSLLRDFADTAAVMDALDLVISVCTAPAHLSGALGQATWVLLPRKGLHWPWGVGRSDAPWYPGVMRLFRQERIGDWAPVIDDVRVALQALVAEREARAS